MHAPARISMKHMQKHTGDIVHLKKKKTKMCVKLTTLFEMTMECNGDRCNMYIFMVCKFAT